MVANEKSEQVKATEHSPSFSSSFCGNLFFFYRQDVSTKVVRTERSEGRARITSNHFESSYVVSHNIRFRSSFHIYSANSCSTFLCLCLL